MWDPDLIFDTSKNYFTEHVGERVLAPTWGGYKDMKEIPLSLSYLQEAKRAGMKITPLLHNDFDLQETKKLLHDSGAVQNLVRQITATALVYDFDGWNLDLKIWMRRISFYIRNLLKQYLKNFICMERKFPLMLR